MIVQTINVSDCTPQTIVIGRRGTYDTLQIAFDLSYLVESYGDGVAVLAVKRSQDESAYPAVTSQEDNLLLWTVSETDTFYPGLGECELMWYVDGGLAKTIIYPCVVMKDILATSEEAPDAYQEWVDSLIAEGAETLQNAQDAAQSASDAETAKGDAVAAKEAAEAILEEFTTPTASATTLSAGSEATATYSDGNFAFGIPRGADGDPGDPGVTPDFSIGTVTTLEPTQPATATITGTAEAPVLNLGIPKGAKGDPGQGGGSVDSVNGQTGDVVLDAGDLEFDDTETYAAGSVGAELSQQKNAISQNEESIENINKTIGVNVLETIGSMPGYINAAGNISPAGAETKEITYNQIAVNENDKLKLSVKIGGDPWFAIGYYGSDMSYIKRDTWTSYDTFDGTYYEKTVLITVPENVYAIRVSMRTYDNYDAELVFDGNMQSAINSLRDDVDTLDENVSGITGDAQNSAKALQTLNLFNRSSYTVGQINSDGTTYIVNYNKTGTTDFIPVEAGEYYTLQEWATPLGDSNAYKLGYTVLFFDSNKSPIASSYKQTLAPSVLDTYFAMTLVAPSSAKYVRISVRYLDTQETRLMINKGTLAMAYLKSSDDMDADRQSVLNSLSSIAYGLTSPLLRPAYPRVMMHRGFSSQAPENTIPAFVLAGQGGAWGIETDVYETIDGYFVLSHDNDVSRMTDGTGNITEMTYAQTQECTIDAGSNVDQYPNLKMPVLSDYLKICRKYGCIAAIEIKTITNYDKLVKVIKDYGMEGSVVILTNYSADKLTTIRNLIQCPLCFVCTGQAHINTLLTVAQNNVDIWASVYSLYITQENIDACHELSMPFVGWTYTTQSGCESAVNMGMDIITAENFAKYIPQ